MTRGLNLSWPPLRNVTTTGDGLSLIHIPYYYKGGYFHGIHYGSYFDDAESLYRMIEKEERFILESPERRRIMIDLYETSLTPEVLEAVIRHIGRLSPRIVKLSIAADRKNLRVLDVYKRQL